MVETYRECHRNRTLYEMLQLERVLDVTSLSESVRRMNISEEVRRLTANLAFDQQMVLLTSSAKEQLRAFANSEVLSVNFTAYSLALERDITNVNLLDMAIVLNSTAMDIQVNAPFEKSPKISDGSGLNGTLGNDFGTFELSSEAKIVILLL